MRKKRGGGNKFWRARGSWEKCFIKNHAHDRWRHFCVCWANEFLFSPESKLSSLLCWLAGWADHFAGPWWRHYGIGEVINEVENEWGEILTPCWARLRNTCAFLPSAESSHPHSSLRLEHQFQLVRGFIRIMFSLKNKGGRIERGEGGQSAVFRTGSMCGCASVFDWFKYLLFFPNPPLSFSTHLISSTRNILRTYMCIYVFYAVYIIL